MKKKPKGSLVSELLDKRHRPFHGFTLGAVLVLSQSLWGILALIGSLIMIISAFALILGKVNKKN